MDNLQRFCRFNYKLVLLFSSGTNLKREKGISFRNMSKHPMPISKFSLIQFFHFCNRS